jgi:hypothetical protein
MNKNKIKKYVLNIFLIILFLFIFFMIIPYNVPEKKSDVIFNRLKERINTQLDQSGTLSLTDEINIYSKKNIYISAITIIDEIKLSDIQVKFILNGYEDHFGVLENNDVLEVKASSSVTYQFGVLCHQNIQKLQESINERELIIKETNITESGFDTDSTSKVCIIFPVKR